MKTSFIWSAVCIVITLFVPQDYSRAQESCGSIIEIYGTDRYESLIEDCDNPFGIVVENQNLKISYNTTEISEGGVYPFVGTVSPFNLTGTHPAADYTVLNLYKTVTEGYERINEDDNGEYSFTTPGTYTVVVSEDELILSQNILHKFVGLIVPTAHAFPGVSAVVTFTVTEPTEEPQGISNILFLPGIQASRLYMKEGGEEEQLWEPFGTQDYVNLQMSDNGESINDIYTHDVIDEIYGGLGGDVYRTFIDFLDEIDGADGPLVQVFPYDWRYDVMRIVEEGVQYESGLYKKLVDTVNYLASLSDTKKVTIIAHSNGGLLAKALMIKLEELGKADQVDKVIFVATPHIGTPKAIAALLHGYDQEQAFNIPANANDIRAVMKNMPGVYGLLPSDAYVDTLDEPLITFDSSTTTKLYRDQYGFAVSNMTEYQGFLNGVEGRQEEADKIFVPTKTDSALLDEALEMHENALDSWEAPEGIEVFNIIGIGLKTVKSIEYREFVQDYCGSLTCIVSKLEPVVNFTLKGDETVVAKSAARIQSDSLRYINLAAEEEHEHANITESETVQSLINVILHGSSTEGIEYVTDIEPTLDSRPIKVDRIHSPARIYIEDNSGRRTGRDSASQVWKEEIPDTDYYEIGGVKYLFKPTNLNHRVIIEGEGDGIFTHVEDEFVNEEQTELHTLIASVTPQTRLTYQYVNGNPGPVSVDLNGDGTTDYQLTIDGVPIDMKATYTELKTAIRNLKLIRIKEGILLGIVSQAEQFYKKRTDTRNGRVYEKLEEGSLYLLDQTLIQLRKAKLISSEAYQGIKSIIDKLIKQ